MPDNRDVLAQMMALKQPPPGGLGAPAPTMAITRPTRAAVSRRLRWMRILKRNRW